MNTGNVNVNQDWDSCSIDHYKCVETIKKQLRKGNWKYLHQHPEIRAIIRVFLHEMINKQPDNMYEFAAGLFNRNHSPLLTTMINQQLKRVHTLLKNSRYSEYDGEMLFGKSESSHSLVSKSSFTESVNSILSYACVLPDKDVI